MNGSEPYVFSSLNEVVAGMVAFAVNFGGLLAVGFALKMSKGVIGGVSNLLKGNSDKFQSFIKGNPNDPGSLQNRVKHKVGQNARATAVHRINAAKSWTTGSPGENAGTVGKAAWNVRRRAANAVIGAVQGYGVDLGRRQAEENERFDKYIGQKTGNGDDNLERAFFAKQWTNDDYTFKDPGSGKVQTLQKGRYYSTSRGADGTYKEFSAGDVTASHRLYDRDEGKIQTLVKYELGKVSNDAEMYGVDRNGNVIYDPTQIAAQNDASRQPMGGFLGNLPSTLRDAGLNYSSAAGASIGAFYAKQGERRELKHTKLQDDWTWKQSTDDFVQDFAENVGSYSAASGKTSQINRLTELYNQYANMSKRSATQNRTMADFERIARALDTRMNSGVMTSSQAVDPGNIAGTQAASGGTSGGSGRTNEAVQRFIQTVRGGAQVYEPGLKQPGEALGELKEIKKG